MSSAKDPARVRWTAEMEEQLVELWQQHDCLFNVSSKKYHNRTDKEKCWGEVASVLNVPVEEVKIRATTLRTQFTKLLKPKPSVSGEKDLTQKQSWLLRNLEFLKKHVLQRPSETTLDWSVKDIIYSQATHDPLSDEDILETSEAPGPHSSATQGEEDHASPFPKARHGLKRNKGDPDTIEQQKLKLLEKMSASVLTAPDPYSAFGNQVAVELGLIKNKSIQTKVKRQIMNALFEGQEADQSIQSPSSHMPPSTYSSLTPTYISPSLSHHYYQHLPHQGPVPPQNYLSTLRDLEE